MLKKVKNKIALHITHITHCITPHIALHHIALALIIRVSQAYERNLRIRLLKKVKNKIALHITHITHCITPHIKTDQMISDQVGSNQNI